MAKGKFLNWASNKAKLLEGVVPGIGIAGALASSASKMMAKKQSPAQKKKTEDKVAAAQLKINYVAGTMTPMERLKIFAMSAWVFMTKYWFAFLPAVLVLMYLLVFKTKRRARRRPVRRYAVGSARRVTNRGNRRIRSPTRSKSSFVQRMQAGKRRAKARRAKR